MNHSIDSEEAFIRSAHEFRLVRSEALEKEYYITHSDGGNHRLCNQRYHEILELLGDKKWMMIEYADRDADCRNPNPDYFYNYGFHDCFMFLRMIHFVAGKDISLEKILLCGEMDRFLGRPEPERFYETLDDL